MSTRSPSAIASVIVFLMAAFQLAWPAFAYSIRDDREAKRTYSYVLTYLLFSCAGSRSRSARWRPGSSTPRPEGRLRARRRRRCRCSRFATAAYAGYTVLAIGIGRARQTQYNWIVAGIAAA